MRTLKSTLATAIATALIASGATLAGAQTPATPSTTTPPASTAPSTPSAAADMAGKHSMDGEVTRVDAKKGWVHVKTSEGTMIMHFPPADLASVKKGDKINVSLALKDNGPAPKDTPRKTTR